MVIIVRWADVDDFLNRQLEKAVKDAQDIPPETVLNVPEAELVQELVDRYSIVPPQLRHQDMYTTGARDVQVDVSCDPSRYIEDRSKPFYVSGTRYEVRVPFDGDPEYFELFWCSLSHAFRNGKVEDQELVIRYEAPADQIRPKKIENELNHKLNTIQECLEQFSQRCKSFNKNLRDALTQAVKQRKGKVLCDRDLEAFLKIPVKRRPDASPVFSVPVPARRKPPQATQSRPSVIEPFRPEPAISPEDYAEILTVVRSYRDLVERLPWTFGPMREEVLRDILLVVLNNQFGPVGGEVFSRKGKTDIFIWHENSAVFIAECKFWKGSKAFREALDQLLGYLVWRDTKAALILYVREKNVTDVVEKADEVFKTHPRSKRREADVATFPVYALHHDGDPNQEIKIALVIVPLPKERNDE
ncbi:MAG: hypothetical protein AA908_08495 [Chlorobi bacterium NICIL-2]|nr:MAG: hypothetical protein AA908_08495 [Chlorobi bacterium NICIL-2]